MVEEGSKRGGGKSAIPLYNAAQIEGIRHACKVWKTTPPPYPPRRAGIVSLSHLFGGFNLFILKTLF